MVATIFVRTIAEGVGVASDMAGVLEAGWGGRGGARRILHAA